MSRIAARTAAFDDLLSSNDGGDPDKHNGGDGKDRCFLSSGDTAKKCEKVEVSP
jgi:hypothetical protein